MDKQFMKGNEAIAEAAIRAGCRFFAGYPITPQNEIPEYMSRRLPEVNGIFLQGESEIASIYMVYGAACAGVRAMTSSSGPGISLKAEGLSYLAGAALPAVIVDVARTGPGLGQIYPGQNDYSFLKAPGHGGFSVMLLAPASVQEAADLTCLAFDLADRDLNPVVVLADGVIGAMMEAVVLPDERSELPDKTDWVIDGCQGRPRRVNRSADNDLDVLEQFQQKKAEMYEKWQHRDVMVEEFMIEDAEVIIAAYGISARIAKTAILQLRTEGLKVGLIRPITLVPFPYSSFEQLDCKLVKDILIIEMCIPSQMINDVKLGVFNRIPIHTYGRGGGNILSPIEVVDAVKRISMKVE
jgi:2-oxoglutarate ferredoxin oxidoreductase subunit alpha